jgi:hypothetical protein
LWGIAREHECRAGFSRDEDQIENVALVKIGRKFHLNFLPFLSSESAEHYNELTIG